MATLPDLVRQMQAIVAEYLPPDSGISDRDCLGSLIEILDGREMIEAQEREHLK